MEKGAVIQGWKTCHINPGMQSREGKRGQYPRVVETQRPEGLERQLMPGRDYEATCHFMGKEKRNGVYSLIFTLVLKTNWRKAPRMKEAKHRPDETTRTRPWI